MFQFLETIGVEEPLYAQMTPKLYRWSEKLFWYSGDLPSLFTKIRSSYIPPESIHGATLPPTVSKPAITVQNKCDSNTSPQEYRMSVTEIERLQFENVTLRAEIEMLKRTVLDLSLRVMELESMSSTKMKVGSIERNVKERKKRKRKSFGSSYLLLPRHMKKFVKATTRSGQLNKTELHAVEVDHVEDVFNELNKESDKDIEAVLKGITEEAQVQKEVEKENIKIYTREKLNSDEVSKKVDVADIVLVHDSDTSKNTDSSHPNLNYPGKLKIGANKADFIDEALLRMKNRSSVMLSQGLVMVNRQEIEELLHTAWITDSILDAFGLLLQKRQTFGSKNWRNFIFLSSNFLYQYSMKSWKSKSLFYLKDITEAIIADADFLMAPIHNKSHWTLLVCELKSKKLDNIRLYTRCRPHRGIARQLAFRPSVELKRKMRKAMVEFIQIEYLM